MTAIQNFDFEDHLVRVIEREGEPWFVGNDVCRCLALSNPRKAIGDLDPDEKGVTTGDTLGGRQELNIVSEPGVFRLIFRSRKPEAERFKRWLAHEVLPQIRRTGAYAPDRPAEPLDVSADAPLMARVEAVRLAARLFGRDRARSLWVRMGLPGVPPAPAGDGLGEARACLRVLLEHEPVDGRTVRRLIVDAVDDDTEAALLLLGLGVRVTDDGEAFLVANVSPALERIYEGTEWARRGWRMPLRRLEGANPTGTIRFTVQGKQSRATYLPLDAIDEKAWTR